MENPKPRAMWHFFFEKVNFQSSHYMYLLVKIFVIINASNLLESIRVKKIEKMEKIIMAGPEMEPTPRKYVGKMLLAMKISGN